VDMGVLSLNAKHMYLYVAQGDRQGYLIHVYFHTREASSARRCPVLPTKTLQEINPHPKAQPLPSLLPFPHHERQAKVQFEPRRRVRIHQPNTRSSAR